MKVYKVQMVGNLMVVRAYLRGPEAEAYPRLLVDTGSTYTIIAHELLESIGCSPALAKERRRVTTASGYEMLPVVQVQQFRCLGQSMEDTYVLAHTFPFGTYVDGLLGMDFMRRFWLEIRPFSGEIAVRDETP
ncbi:MAG: transcriptional regulator [Candidatus Latescibacterota bacterium]|nr:MAG: transcriptional regulator [Candidatus Latescibacterota bacterium]